MFLDGQHNRRRAFVLALLFALVTGAAAEEGILVLQVVDARHHPFSNVRIALAGEGGSPQNSDQNGRLRLRLAPNTKPFAWATLLLKGGPGGMDLTFVSPFDEPARVRVPPFDNEQDNFDEVVVVKEGDREMLEHGSGRLAIEAAGGAAQRSAPKSQYRPLFGEPRLLTVALRLGPGQSNEHAAMDQMSEVAMLAAAKKYGLSLADIKAAVAYWGGTSLVWKSFLLTASIEAGGTDPFPYVHATSNDIIFGAGSWSLRGCTLQPLLRKFDERNHERFTGILGKEDAEWLNEALKAPCDASSNIMRERMLEGSGALRHSWWQKFRTLGNEPLLEHAQVEEMTRQLKQAEAQAAALGMTSNQAVAYFAYIATQAGPAIMTSQQQTMAQEVAAFRQQNGREPDQQEQLLMLGNLVAASLKSAAPAFPAEFLAKGALLAGGEGNVLGSNYRLADFGIGLNDWQTGAELPLHHDQQILSKLAAGWVPSQSVPVGASPGAKPGSPASGQASFPSSTHQASPRGSQFDQPAEHQLTDLINHERTQRGLAPLQLEPRLTDAARLHSVQMAQHQTIAHAFPGEAPLVTRYTDRDLRTSYNGETIARDTSAPAAHHAFMSDAAHRDIILNPIFNSVGVGVVNSGGLLYVTEDFAQVQQNYSNDSAASAVQDAIATYAAGHNLPAPALRPEPLLQQAACNLAKTHVLDAPTLQAVAGFRSAVAWATANLQELPVNATSAISQPLSGYSLGVCFAPDSRAYWVVMVTY